MKKRTFKQKCKEGYKAFKKEAIRQIKLFPYYLLLAILLIFALKTVPDWLITHVKPEHLNDSQAITYFCTIIASFVTIIGIFLTLNHNQKMVKDQLKQNDEKFSEERRLSVLPVITLNRILIDEVFIAKYFKIESEEKKETPQYNSYYSMKEYKLEEVVIRFTKVKPIFTNHLVDADKRLINMGPIREDDKIKYYPYLYKPYYIVNSGIGTAVNMMINLYRVKQEKDNRINLIACSPEMNLSPGQEFRLTFYAPDINDVGEEYRLEIQYCDIYKNRYIQNHYIGCNPSNSIFIITTNINQELDTGIGWD